MDSVEKLNEILQELTAQRTRLDARAREIDELIAAKPENVAELALQISAEAFREVVETGVEFSHAITEAVIQLANEAPPEGEDGDGDGDGVEIGIEPEHHEIISGPLIEHRDMLDALLSGQLGETEKSALLKKRAATVQAIELVDELVFEDDEAPESGTQDSDEG